MFGIAHCTQEAFKIDCLKCSEKFYTFIVIWGYVRAEDLDKLWILTRVNYNIFTEVFEHFMISSSEDVLKNNFFFQ